MIERLADIADALSLPPEVAAVLAAILLVLCVGSVLRLAAAWRSPDERVRERLGSLAAWWAMLAALAAALAFGHGGIVTLAGLAALLAMREFTRMLGLPAREPAALLALALVATQFALVGVGWAAPAMTMLPVAAPVLLVAVWLVRDRVRGFRRRVAPLIVGVMLCGYLLSHVGWFALDGSLAGREAGLVLFLVLLTALNDIFQAQVGRVIGRHKLAPTVSPGKTWEGLAGGLTVTLLAAVLMAPWLTPFFGTAPGWLDASDGDRSVDPFTAVGLSLLAGLLICLAGLLGDMMISAFKRDVGVKDAGDLIPGQGGMLDRVDSLTVTAPVFHGYLALLYG